MRRRRVLVSSKAPMHNSVLNTSTGDLKDLVDFARKNRAENLKAKKIKEAKADQAKNLEIKVEK